MFKSYLITALRSLKRSKLYSFINIAGLAVGMACCLLLFLYVRHQLSFDLFHENKDQIVRILHRFDPKETPQSHTPAPLGAALQNQFPEIARYLRVEDNSFFVRYQDKRFLEYPVLLADSSIFEVFTFPLIAGDPRTALRDPDSIVITQETAKKYFGGENPMGKTLTFRLTDPIDFKVTGIAQDVPANSHLQFNMVIPFIRINELYDFNYLASWGAFNFSTYLWLNKNASIPQLGAKIIDFIRKTKNEQGSQLFLQPLARIHLESTNTIRYMIFFTAVAIIILLSSCINYANLFIAASSSRAKEIGLRKVTGADRGQLVRQFLGESVVMPVIALPLAMGMIQMFLPLLNALTNSEIRINYLQHWPTLLMFLLLALTVGLLSGSYPAFYLASLPPVQSLKGTFASSFRRPVFRNLLIIFQFAISIFLITGTLLISRQLSYAKHKDMGFDNNNVVAVPLYGRAVRQNLENVKNELLSNKNILQATASAQILPTRGTGNITAWWEGKQENERKFFSTIEADYDFLKTYRLQIIQGRDFSEKIQSDVLGAYILNETAVRELGWQNPVGKQFQIERSAYPKGVVIGVVKDFNFRSLHYQIRPLAIFVDPKSISWLSIRVAKDNIPAALDFMKTKFREFNPDAPFEYVFPDDQLKSLYREDEKTGRMFNSFTILAVFIACLGLLGLSSFAIARRTKEIGIRKVLGAPLRNIVGLLSREFIFLVLLANVLAWPAAYLIVKQWLKNFVYRIGISPWIFIISGTAAILLALLTIIYKVVKAALANPVDSLRYE